MQHLRLKVSDELIKNVLELKVDQNGYMGMDFNEVIRANVLVDFHV